VQEVLDYFLFFIFFELMQHPILESLGELVSPQSASLSGAVSLFASGAVNLPVSQFV
jgi:hypothetical protein